MKLRLGADGTTTTPLPGDLTGQVVTIDLRHVDADHDTGAAALVSELLARGAARLVIAGGNDDAPPSGLAA
ncbi:hypothetical protein [Prescottella sp. R16]|uniref:hypothetical protein n=1 Tax=Prescottella sp. R16 TaxID=3064529 RepID=UPI00272E31CC|nr:hypothetical protein [Prescottella sp. R16]